MADIEGVSIVLGTQYRNQIVDLVNEYLVHRKQIVKVADVMNFEFLKI